MRNMWGRASKSSTQYSMSSPPPSDSPPPPNYPQPKHGTYQPFGQMHNETTPVVMDPPQATPPVQIVHSKPENYVGLSIFTLLCCCWIFGIVALIYAWKVDSAYSSGDVLRAQSASRSAQTWNIVGIVWGVVSLVLVVIDFIILIPVTLEANARLPHHVNVCLNNTHM